MKRLFVALTIDASIRRVLSGMGGTIPGARCVPEDQLHLTLRFIGEVDGALFLDIKEGLQTVDSTPLTLKVRGVGHFPPRGKPRVLWAGVEPAGDLIILRNKVNRALLQCGVPLEERKFHPHITLARLNDSPTFRVVNFLSGNSMLNSPPFVAQNFVLYSSKLTPKGAIHTVEARYPMT